jgi:hypothetical protein
MKLTINIKNKIKIIKISIIKNFYITQQVNVKNKKNEIAHSETIVKGPWDQRGPGQNIFKGM